MLELSLIKSNFLKRQNRTEAIPLEHGDTLSQYSFSLEAPPRDEETGENLPVEIAIERIIRSQSPSICSPSPDHSIKLEHIRESPIDEHPNIVVDETSSLSSRSTELSSRGDEIPSRLSFIVKEKLHEFAKDIRRRTSQVREEVVREPTPEAAESDAGSIEAPERHASLRSLIGLQQAVPEDLDGSTSTWWSPIDPFGRRYSMWLFFVVVAFLYNVYGIPLRNSFPYQTPDNLVYWLIADYTSDAIYLVDMLLVKPRLIFMKGGVTVKEPQEMFKHYVMSGGFKLDLISLLPLDLFYFAFGDVITALRVVRFFKILSFWEFFDLLDSSFSNPYVVRIVKTFSYMIYLIHCNSCIYYMLSAWQAFGQIPYVDKYSQPYLNKWVYNNQGNAYLRCFYFTTAIATSAGSNPSPTNVIEYAYMTLNWMMGVFVFALLLGQIRDIVSNARKNDEEYRSTMDKALSECKRLELPEHIVDRVRSWFLYTWEQQKTLDERKLIEKLPLKLQTDLALSVHYTTLSKVKLFQECDRALLKDLVLKLRPVIFLPGDMICRKGDVGKEMYIVNQGILEVVGGEQNEITFATLTEGSVFGEISLLAIGGNNRRTANIRSKGFSTLFVLSKEDLNDVIKDYPDAQQVLRRKARQMLKKDEKKEETDKELTHKDLAEKCKVSADLRVPKLLQTVAKVLHPQSEAARNLRNSFDSSNQLRRRLTRWSTIPDDFSDISDTEMPDMHQIYTRSTSYLG
uniref:Cyclic nucleotide-binding domain-containing protein n=1 Tax=Acrobeloides nanus TaxID=290746 RepID=A0A914D369_9BILA